MLWNYCRNYHTTPFSRIFAPGKKKKLIFSDFHMVGHSLRHQSLVLFQAFKKAPRQVTVAFFKLFCSYHNIAKGVSKICKVSHGLLTTETQLANQDSWRNQNFAGFWYTCLRSKSDNHFLKSCKHAFVTAINCNFLRNWYSLKFLSVYIAQNRGWVTFKNSMPCTWETFFKRGSLQLETFSRIYFYSKHSREKFGYMWSTTIFG